MSGFCQDIQSVRYNVTPNIMLDLIDKYPQKKEHIEKRIKSELMKYVDFILIENELVQVYWRHDISLMSIKIYSKNKIYNLSSENELTEDSVNSESDTVFYKRIKNTAILYHYELTETNAVPLLIKLTDSLANDSFEQKTPINDYPEIGFIIDFKIFLEELVFGKPKSMMTFDSMKTLEKSPIESNEYLELISSIKSKNKRKKVLDRISERKPLATAKYSK